MEGADKSYNNYDYSDGALITNNITSGISYLYEAFGGSSPYILSGLPNVPHIYEIIAPTSASAASGLEVTVKIAIEK